MKKLVFISAIASLLLSACAKDQNINKQDNKKELSRSTAEYVEENYLLNSGCEFEDTEVDTVSYYFMCSQPSTNIDIYTQWSNLSIYKSSLIKFIDEVEDSIEIMRVKNLMKEKVTYLEEKVNRLEKFFKMSNQVDWLKFYVTKTNPSQELTEAMFMYPLIELASIQQVYFGYDGEDYKMYNFSGQNLNPELMEKSLALMESIIASLSKESMDIPGSILNRYKKIKILLETNVHEMEIKR